MTKSRRNFKFIRDPYTESKLHIDALEIFCLYNLILKLALVKLQALEYLFVIEVPLRNVLNICQDQRLIDAYKYTNK